MVNDIRTNSDPTRQFGGAAQVTPAQYKGGTLGEYIAGKVYHDVSLTIGEHNTTSTVTAVGDDGSGVAHGFTQYMQGFDMEYDTPLTVKAGITAPGGSDPLGLEEIEQEVTFTLNDIKQHLIDEGFYTEEQLANVTANEFVDMLDQDGILDGAFSSIVEEMVEANSQEVIDKIDDRPESLPNQKFKDQLDETAPDPSEDHAPSDPANEPATRGITSPAV